MTLNGAEASRLCSQVLDPMGTVKIYDLTTSELRVMGALLSGARSHIFQRYGRRRRPAHLTDTATRDRLLGHGGHTIWTCRTCDQTVYGPLLNTHCTCLDGPATVRISNHPS
jgi:hypothetical protein